MILARRDARETLAATIAGAVNEAIRAGELPDTEIPAVELEIPKEKAHGDYATNIALKLSRTAHKAPRAVAEAIVAHIDRHGGIIDQIEIAGPGFINFHLGRPWLRQVIAAVLDDPEGYGRVPDGDGQRVLLEYVSANPTGPLHVGHGRGAAVGSALHRILQAAGYDIDTEFYINDAGNQIQNFARSLEVRFLQQLGRNAELPEDGYHGQDVIELAKSFISEHGDGLKDADEETRRRMLADYALKCNIARLAHDLDMFGVTFNRWFSEQTLHESGAVQRTVEYLQERGHIYELDGARWFKTTPFGDDKDRVLIRANGLPTYMAVDIAYHYDKYERGYQKLINIWGADHHGYIPRMKAAVEALGRDPESLQVVIVQMVSFISGGEPLVMSKRTGQLITLAELVEEVGRDAARFFFILRSSDSQFEFDMDLAKSQSNENPVYYVQYAHARVASIFRQAGEQGYQPGTSDLASVDALTEEAEVDLIKKISEFPEEVAGTAASLGPHRLTRYLIDLAGMFHSYYNAHRVLVDDPAVRNARLVLAKAVGITVRRGLELLGLSAPERM